MSSSPQSVEHVMLSVVAYHDPIDYHSLKRIVGERLVDPYSTELHREALQNLQELELVERAGLGHEYIHITSEGWSRLGGETPRYDSGVQRQDDHVCTVCATDEYAEPRW